MEEALKRIVIGACAAILAGLAPVVHAELRCLVVSGLGGDEDYEQRFAGQAERVTKALITATGDASKVVALTGAQARREAVQRELRALGTDLRAEDRLVLVLIGHGTFDGDEYRLNLPGPDITGTELAALLDRIPAREQLVINATSSSGAMLAPLKRASRVVVTATRSGAERNAPRFGEFWAQALSSSEADRDKDEIITASEAYDFASRKVADAFTADVALATEHSQLQGERAASFVLARLGSAGELASNPAAAALIGERTEIEKQLDELKARKSTLDENTYYDELEKVLIGLARLQRRIDEIGGKQDAATR